VPHGTTGAPRGTPDSGAGRSGGPRRAGVLRPPRDPGPAAAPGRGRAAPRVPSPTAWPRPCAAAGPRTRASRPGSWPCFAVALGVLPRTAAVSSALVTALTVDIGRRIWRPGPAGQPGRSAGGRST